MINVTCLKRPIMTTKSRTLLKQNKMVFEIDKNANKPMVKKAVAEMWKDAKIKNVAIINLPGRSKRTKQGIVVVGALKKAIVTFEEIPGSSVAK